MILNDYVEIKVNSNNIKYYENLGYEIPRKIGSKGKIVYDKSKYISVKIKDVNPESTVLVSTTCDVCGRIKDMRMCSYTHRLSKDGLYRCKKCNVETRRKTNIERYGVEHLMKDDEFKNNFKQTMKEKYGVEWALQNKDLLEKQHNSLLEHYGTTHALCNEELLNKCKETNLKKFGETTPLKSEQIKCKIRETNLMKYGYENPMSSKQVQNILKDSLLNKYGVDSTFKIEGVKEKIKQTYLEKYGTENPFQLEEIKEKSRRTMYKNGTCPTSKQQKYICELYGGVLNFPFKSYNIDIMLDDKYAIEYDGSGHDICVKYNTVTDKDFKRKKIIRCNYLKLSGYKNITFISKTDKLPCDKILIEILNISKNYFESTEHSWIEWYFDEGIFKNAENPNGVLFNFGTLTKLKTA